MLAKKPRGAVERRQSSGISSLLWIFVGSILTLLIGLVLYLLNPFDIGSEEKVEEHVVEPINQNKTESGEYEFYDLLPDQEMISVPDEAIFDESELSGRDRELRPDVVVTDSEDNSASTNNRDPENYGISEETIMNPMGSQQPSRIDNDQEIVIIEEEGTYDEPATNSNTRSQSSTRQSGNTQASSSAAQRNQTARKSYILQINSYNTAEEADKRRAQVLLAGVDVHVVKNKRANGQIIYQVVSSSMTNRQAVVAAQQKLQNNGIDSLVVEQRR